MRARGASQAVTDDHFYDRKRRTGTYILVYTDHYAPTSSPSWMWHYPGSFDDVRARWASLKALRAAFIEGEGLPSEGAYGALDDLPDCSFGSLQIYFKYADAHMVVDQEGAALGRTFPLSESLPWP